MQPTMDGGTARKDHPDFFHLQEGRPRDRLGLDGLPSQPHPGRLREHLHPDEYPCDDLRALPMGPAIEEAFAAAVQKRPPKLGTVRSEAEWEDLLAKPALSAFGREVTPLDKFAASTSWQRHVSTSVPGPTNLDTWMEADETLLIFDWDDTLCPTSHVRADPLLSLDEVAPCFRRLPGEASWEGEREFSEMRALLEQHADTVRELLVLASGVGRVQIVTLAQPEWVEDSIRHFMPSLAGLIEELDIQVIHARSANTPSCQRASLNEGKDLGQILKTQAIAWAARHFYGTGRDGCRARSWKNVLSIGDSDVERLALQDVIFRRVQTDGEGNWRECRCKTLKLLEEPTLEQLTGQLQSLTSWLIDIAHYDGDVDVDLGEALQDVNGAFSKNPPC